ncbi:adenylate synthase [Aliarcobacter butzleri]|uniref:F390 synthetase-related protein n=1 Tax=Aliarcobacter butzleri TaxID=28197 RepID=UPI00263EEE54|nr:F390 synthetase-related protein [Aliarcobacter butzleri]MDN5041961.1 adenylate synthase [Aliarcobacter butzleri]
MFKKLKIIKQYLKTKDFYDKKELENHQKKSLLKLFKNLNSNFYPNFLELENYPIINKKIFMDNFNSINSLQITQDEAFKIALAAEKSRDFSSKLKNVTVGLSSGTTGNRGIFLVSEDESALWAGYILKRMLPKPLLQKHKIAFFLRSNSNLYESVNSSLISFSFYDLINPLENHIKKLNDTKPTVLIAPAQVLKLLALNKDLNINPIKIISVAEVLEEDDKQIVEKRFSLKVHQVYQCTEGFLAHTCKEGNLHLNEDIVYIEKDWIDEKSGRFSPIITDFNRKSQPIIRYKLDDILILEKESCPCGCVFTRIKKIEGRCDDILKMKTLQNQDYLLFPDFVRNAIISSNTSLEEYLVIKEKDELNIYLKPQKAKNEIDKVLLNLYKIHNLKPLKHNYFEYTAQKLDKKRRRVQEI